MRSDLLLLHNIRELLIVRRRDQRELAKWVGHHETWLSKILQQSRGIRLQDVDKIADFFGLTTYQLFQPGISALTERRRGDRRAGRERRNGQDRRRTRAQKKAAEDSTEPIVVAAGQRLDHRGRWR